MFNSSLSKIGLRTRTVAMLGILVLLALSVMGATNYFYGSRLAIRKTLGVAKEKMTNDALLIGARVVEEKGELIILRETPPVQGIIRARDHGGIDPETGDKIEYWYLRMEQIFAAFLAGKPNEYHQLCYLDEQGNELARVELIEGSVKIIPRDKLRNLAAHSYVAEALKLKEGEAYYADVALHRVDGEIAIPYLPSWQIATPVYDGKKKVRGLLVVSIDARWLFSNIHAGADDTKRYLIDQDGYFLAHSDRYKEFGFDLGSKYSIRNEHPRLAEEMLTTDSGISQHRGLKFNLISGFQKIFFDPGNKQRFWTVVCDIPEAIALGDVYKMQKTMLMVGLAITICSIGVILWLALREIIFPLTSLIEAARKMEAGDLSVRLPEDNVADEFRLLHHTLNAFAEKQQNAIEHFEKELALRTSKLEASNLELQQFASIASHDLQEPLRKITAFGDRLAAHAREALDEKSKDYLERMQSAAGRMKQLIEDLLNYSRVTTQAMPFEAVSLDDLIGETLVMLELRIAETGGQVEIAGKLPAVHGDRSQLRQLIQNLLSNALKYHRHDLPPRIIISGQELAEGLAEITVTDNGIGFDEKYLDRIFLPFQRLHTREEYEGTGIGLAISQKIVHRHGGTITGRSQPGAGSSFIITLPMAGKV